MKRRTCQLYGLARYVMPDMIRLALFLTRNLSLSAWADAGILEREMALYRRLRDRGVRVTVVSYGDRRDLPYAEELSGIDVVCNRWKRGCGPGWLPNAWYRRLLPTGLFLRGKGCDVVKSNQVMGADVAMHAARRVGARFVARCGYLYSVNISRELGKQAPAAQAARDLESRVFRGADRVIVTTSSMRDTVCASYRIDPANVSVIPNYVDTVRFSPGVLGAPDTVQVCFVGRLSEEKNLSSLISAMRGVDARLVIMGDGPLRTALSEQAERENVAARFLGSVPNTALPSLLNASSVFVLPSLYEGHPKALLEAMACGLAVVGTDVPGIREVIAHGRTGWLCEADPESIHAAIAHLIAHPDLRAELGRNAREYVQASFSLDRIVELELQMYEEVLG